MPKPIIAFIGAGNIARCFIAGLLKTKCDPTNIIVSNRSKDKLIAFKKEFNVVIAENNSAAVEPADIVVLAVKPHVITDVCQEISPSIQRKNPLIISFSTATPIKYITDVLAAHKVAVVRAMDHARNKLDI
jgi:pyrroline-5-carboxylate reductase